MPKYFFHIDHGDLVADHDGIELAGTPEAAALATKTAGQFLQDMSDRFVVGRAKWRMHVTDSDQRLLFTLRIGSAVPSGEVRFAPLDVGRSPDN